METLSAIVRGLSIDSDAIPEIKTAIHNFSISHIYFVKFREISQKISIDFQENSKRKGTHNEHSEFFESLCELFWLVFILLKGTFIVSGLN